MLLVMFALLLGTQDYRITRYDHVPTKQRWVFIESPATEVSWWQPLPPKGEHSVFEIEDAGLRDQEIYARQNAPGRPGSTAGCPVGMVRASGVLRDRVETTERQNAACEDRNWNPRFLCTQFDPAKLIAPPTAPTQEMSFCVDRYEFPNVPGEYPGVLFSWKDGEKLCGAQGKRLCTEDEWVFACEGPEALPYPNGYDRYLDPNSHFPDRVITGDGCNVDVIRKNIRFDESRLRYRNSPGLLIEIDRLWEGTRVGERTACVSPFGVYDMTGNVEEWTTRPRDVRRPSILRGGYWFPVESRCQPGNAFHGPGHSYYQTGFRCCAG